MRNLFKIINLVEIREIISRIIEANFDFEFIIRSTLSPSKNRLAKVVIKPGIDSFSYFVTVSEGANEVLRLLLLEGKPDTFFTYLLFSKIKFNQENEIIIQSKNGLITFTADVMQGEVNLINKSPSLVHDYYEVVKKDGKRLLQ
jgi:hypothetical protein